MFGTLFALLTAFSTDYESIQSKGFFYGYNNLVWLNIVIQSAGGLLVAVVIKYADNILKGFATSIAIIVSCLASSYLFNTVIDTVFAFGTMMVVVSVMLYSYVPPQSPQSSLSGSPIKMMNPLNGNGASSFVASDLIQYKLINSNSSPSSSSTSSLINNDISIEMNSK